MPLNDYFTIKHLIGDHVSKIEFDQKAIVKEWAFPCDLSLDLHLVPKLWVKESVQSYLATFAIKACKSLLLLNLDLKHSFFTYKKAVEQGIAVVSMPHYSINEFIEKQRE